MSAPRYVSRLVPALVVAALVAACTHHAIAGGFGGAQGPGQPADPQLTDLAAITPSAGVTIYGDGTNLVSLAAGSEGEVLTAHGAAAPTWAAAGGGAIDGTAGQWTVDASGDLVPATTNVDDIGDGTVNPRTVRAGTSVVTPLVSSGFDVDLNIGEDDDSQTTVTITAPNGAGSGIKFAIGGNIIAEMTPVAQHFVPGVDNVRDLGSTAKGWRTVYADTSVDGGGTAKSVGLLADHESVTAGSGAPNVLTAAESGKIIDNTGATAEVYNTLPGAAAGLVYHGAITDGDGMRFTAAGDDTIRIGGNVTAAAGYVASVTTGSTITLVAVNATEWVCEADGGWTNGTWSEGVWVSWTPVHNWGPNVTATGLAMLDGQTLHVQGKLVMTGTPSTATLNVTLPFSAVGSALSVSSPVPSSVYMVDGATPMGGGMAFCTPSSAVMLFYVQNATAGQIVQVDQAAPFAWATGDEFRFAATVPIQ